MRSPELFKYDVRIRERALRRGLLSEADLKQHLESLSDVESRCATMDLQQPALQKEAAAEPPEAAAPTASTGSTAAGEPVAAEEPVSPAEPPPAPAPITPSESEAGTSESDDEGWGS